MAFFSGRRSGEHDSPAQQDQLPPRPAFSQGPIGFETVLGANCVMEGTLQSEGNVRLDGMFTGTLEIKGNVLVGETAKIHADINARNISIAGAVRGNVVGNKVQLLRTGRIWGDISASALTTEEGGFIDGRITMTGHAANSPESPVTDEAAADDLLPEEDDTDSEVDADEPTGDEDAGAEPA